MSDLDAVEDAICEFYLDDFPKDFFVSKENAEAVADKSDLREKILQAMSNLSPRQREAIVLLYGFGGDLVQYTHAQIAELMGISLSRVHQLRHAALEKMRHSYVLSDLPKERNAYMRVWAREMSRAYSQEQ
jgi:RNA polymerase sigma factor (sigma-70 family)